MQDVLQLQPAASGQEQVYSQVYVHVKNSLGRPLGVCELVLPVPVSTFIFSAAAPVTPAHVLPPTFDRNATLIARCSVNRWHMEGRCEGVGLVVWVPVCASGRGDAELGAAGSTAAGEAAEHCKTAEVPRLPDAR